MVALSRDRGKVDKCWEIVNVFDAQCPQEAPGMPRGHFDFVSYCRQEKMFLQTMSVWDADPMTKDQYMKWAVKPFPDGGDLSASEAANTWDEMKRAPKTYEQDQLGKDRALRIWVPTCEFRRTAFGREESENLNMQQEPEKNIEDEQLAEMRSAVQNAGFSSITSSAWQGRGVAPSLAGQSDAFDQRGLTNMGEFSMGTPSSDLGSL